MICQITLSFSTSVCHIVQRSGTLPRTRFRRWSKIRAPSSRMPVYTQNSIAHQHRSSTCSSKHKTEGRDIGMKAGSIVKMITDHQHRHLQCGHHQASSFCLFGRSSLMKQMPPIHSPSTRLPKELQLKGPATLRSGTMATWLFRLHYGLRAGLDCAQTGRKGCEGEQRNCLSAGTRWRSTAGRPGRG